MKKVPDAKGGSKKSAESEKGTKAGETGDEVCILPPLRAHGINCY